MCSERDQERWRGGVCMCTERDRGGEVECVCVVREKEMWRYVVCMCSEREIYMYREGDVNVKCRCIVGGRWSVYVERWRDFWFPEKV